MSARWPIPVIYANIVFNWNVLSDFILVKFHERNFDQGKASVRFKSYVNVSY